MILKTPGLLGEWGHRPLLKTTTQPPPLRMPPLPDESRYISKMVFFYVKVINQVSPDICQIEKMSGKARVPHAGNRDCFEQFRRPPLPGG